MNILIFRQITLLSTLIFLFSFSGLSIERFTNYSSLITVNDIAELDGVTYAATSGGLLKISDYNSKPQVLNNASDFPDINLTALLAIEKNGDLWIGSKNGYLYNISSDGKHSVYDIYSFSEPDAWDIRKIASYGKYIIIASSRGCSFLDTDNMETTNITEFGQFSSSHVYDLYIHNDSLFAGLAEGYAYIDISGNRLSSLNPYDRNVWNNTASDTPVKSFQSVRDTLNTFSFSSVLKDTIVYIADSNRLSIMDQSEDTSSVLLTFNSKINSLFLDNNSNIWIGTDEDFLYRWDNRKIKQFTANCLTFKYVNRVYVSKKTDDVWFLPKWIFFSDGSYRVPWWQGIASFNGDEWKTFSPDSTPNFGNIGDNDDFRGIGEDYYGNMWFGTSGGNIKRYDKNSKEFYSYLIGLEYDGFKRLDYGEWGNEWGKCDAIAGDSSDYMWFSNYKNKNGCVICYDPQALIPDNSDYVRFFDESSPYYMENINCINVDVNGKIFIGDTKGELLILSYNESPIESKENVNVTNLSQINSNIFDMVSTENGATWISTGEGLYVYSKDTDNTPETTGNSDTSYSLKKINGFPTDITAIEAENDTLLWLGTSSSGLLEYHHAGDDFYNNTLIERNTYHGLIDNSINDLCIDRKSGSLWIATPTGVSQYDLGHTFEKITKNDNMTICPNPFSFSNHKEITFRNIAAFSSVRIYDIRGKLIKILTHTTKNIDESEYGWLVSWQPDKNLSPGTYYVVAAVSNENNPSVSSRSTGFRKILIIP